MKRRLKSNLVRQVTRIQFVHRHLLIHQSKQLNKRHFFPYIVYAQKQKKTKHSKDRQNEKTIIAIDKMIMKKKRESFVF